MTFLSDFEIDSYRESQKDINKKKKKTNKKQKNKKNEGMFIKLANKTAGCKGMGAVEVEILKSIARTEKDKHSSGSLEKGAAKVKRHQKKLGKNNFIIYRKEG